MSDGSGPPPPGWYPVAPRQLGWWDGTAWSSHRVKQRHGQVTFWSLWATVVTVPSSLVFALGCVDDLSFHDWAGAAFFASIAAIGTGLAIGTWRLRSRGPSRRSRVVTALLVGWSFPAGAFAYLYILLASII